MAQFTDFGKEVKKKLIDSNRTQAWLIERITEKTGLYCDSSYLVKILTGRHSSPKIVAAIREIMNLESIA